MSDFTGEGTEFDGGRCRACGASSYGLLSDGPRCYGCKRFVLRDTGATFESDGVEYTTTSAPPALEGLTLEKLDALMADIPTTGTVRMFHSYRARRIAEAFDRAFFADEEPVESRRARRRRIKREQEALKTEDVMAEVDAILKGAATE